MRMRLEAVTTKTGFIQFVRLDHCTHCPIEEQNTRLEYRFKFVESQSVVFSMFYCAVKVEISPDKCGKYL